MRNNALSNDSFNFIIACYQRFFLSIRPRGTSAGKGIAVTFLFFRKQIQYNKERHHCQWELAQPLGLQRVITKSNYDTSSKIFTLICFTGISFLPVELKTSSDNVWNDAQTYPNLLSGSLFRCKTAMIWGYSPEKNPHIDRTNFSISD